eukprot:8871322-Pyramimonas_sp.AAC.1
MADVERPAETHAEHPHHEVQDGVAVDGEVLLGVLVVARGNAPLASRETELHAEPPPDPLGAAL